MLYFSTELPFRHPLMMGEIIAALDRHGVAWETVNTRSNIWVRDFMPVQTATEYTKFVYRTFGHGEYDCLKVPRDSWLSFAPAISRIVLDGGNVVQTGDAVFITKKVFFHNPRIEPTKLHRSLEDLFEKAVHFLPVEPGDWLGHADGILHPCGPLSVFLNDYAHYGATKKTTAFQHRVERVLARAGVEPIMLPYAYHRCPNLTEAEFREKYPNADDMNPAVGYFGNMLTAGKLILLPSFGFEEDARALEIVRAARPGHSVEQVACYGVAMEGGLLNCVSWEHD